MAGQFINAPSPSRREARNFENELDIVIVGNKSDKNVTSGQYVTVRDSAISGITNGIYKATANVAAGTAFVAANLSAVTSGALNDLSGNLVAKYVVLSLSSAYTSGWITDFLDLPSVTTRALFLMYNSTNSKLLYGMKRESDQKIAVNSVSGESISLQNQGIYVSGIFK